MASYLVGVVEFVVHEAGDDAGLADGLVPKEHELVLGERRHGSHLRLLLFSLPRQAAAARSGQIGSGGGEGDLSRSLARSACGCPPPCLSLPRECCAPPPLRVWSFASEIGARRLLALRGEGGRTGRQMARKPFVLFFLILNNKKTLCCTVTMLNTADGK